MTRTLDLLIKSQLQTRKTLKKTHILKIAQRLAQQLKQPPPRSTLPY